MDTSTASPHQVRDIIHQNINTATHPTTSDTIHYPDTTRAGLHHLTDQLTDEHLTLAHSIHHHIPPVLEAWLILLWAYTNTPTGIPAHQPGQTPTILEDPKTRGMLARRIRDTTPSDGGYYWAEPYQQLTQLIYEAGGVSFTLLDAFHVYPFLTPEPGVMTRTRARRLILEHLIRHVLRVWERPGEKPHTKHLYGYLAHHIPTLNEYAPYAADPAAHPALTHLQAVKHHQPAFPHYRFTVSDDTLRKTFDYYRYYGPVTGFARGFLTGTGYTLGRLYHAVFEGPTAADAAETHARFDPILGAVSHWLNLTGDATDEQIAEAVMVSLDVMLRTSEHPAPHTTGGGIYQLTCEVTDPHTLLAGPYPVWAAVRDTYLT